MDNVRPPTVGRTWYVEIRQGTMGARIFLGTRHAATGDQCWQSMTWPNVSDVSTEAAMLDELWAACLMLMEARTHVG